MKDSPFEKNQEQLEEVLRTDPQAIASVLTEDLWDLKPIDERDGDEGALDGFFAIVNSLYEIKVGFAVHMDQDPGFLLVRNWLDVAGFRLVVEPKR